jgi:hypothetical protein
MARQSPNGRPLVGKRLNDTAALVRKGINPPPGCYELHSRPSPECMVTDIVDGGCRPDFADVANPSPNSGNTLGRTLDYLRSKNGC